MKSSSVAPLGWISRSSPIQGGNNSLSIKFRRASNGASRGEESKKEKGVCCACQDQERIRTTASSSPCPRTLDCLLIPSFQILTSLALLKKKLSTISSWVISRNVMNRRPTRMAIKASPVESSGTKAPHSLSEDQTAVASAAVRVGGCRLILKIFRCNNWSICCQLLFKVIE
jgi:hypothetical protein